MILVATRDRIDGRLANAHDRPKGYGIVLQQGLIANWLLQQTGIGRLD